MAKTKTATPVGADDTLTFEQVMALKRKANAGAVTDEAPPAPINPPAVTPNPAATGTAPPPPPAEGNANPFASKE
jgi:hypothetical protein